MVIKTNNKSYIYEFGLKGQILIGENAKYNEDNIPFYLYCGLISKQPDITYQECLEIESTMSEKDKKSIKKYFEDNYKSLSQLEIERLYSQSVGEIGIQPSDFYSMTLKEIDWAYNGFMERKQKEVNLMLLALLNRNKSEFIQIIPDKEYEIGSQEERDKTFQLLEV